MSRQPKSNDVTYGYCPHCGEQALEPHGNTNDSRGRPVKVFKCHGCGKRTRKPLADPTKPKVVHPTAIDLPRRFVALVTSAQNATPVHKAFWDNLQAYRAFRKARTFVVPLRYRNPTSLWSENQENDEWWASEVKDNLFAGRKLLGPGIMLMGDVKTQVTATEPLTGYESLSGPNSAIFGHPQIALQAVAAPQNKTPKLLATTGACTIKNYTSTKAGTKGDFHHSFGATIVEVDGDWFTIRQIVAKDDGSFIDLAWAVGDGKVTKAQAAEGIALGDEHVWFLDPHVAKATFGKDGIVPTLGAKRIFRHDVLDGFTVDHHHAGSPFIAIAKHESDKWDARKEVEDTVRYVLETTPSGAESVIVASNHVDHLGRWIRETDWRQNPRNAVFYLETALAMARGTKMGLQATSTPDPFEYWFRKIQGADPKYAHKNVRILGRDESYSVKGVEFTFHGDKGANGDRGSRKAYARIGTKTIICHSHSPGITEGCYQGGTSSYLKLDYNAGLSSWMHAHVVLYANGKRSLIFVGEGGRWRL